MCLAKLYSVQEEHKARTKNGTDVLPREKSASAFGQIILAIQNKIIA